jgi:hypothetical protein
VVRALALSHCNEMAATPTEQGNNPVDNNSRTKAKKDGQGRKYGFACANCRRRKAKCDGGVPSCSRCLAGGEDCVFNKCVECSMQSKVVVLTRKQSSVSYLRTYATEHPQFV